MEMEPQFGTSSVQPDPEHRNGSIDQSKRQSIGNGKAEGGHGEEKSQVECKLQFDAVNAIARSDLFDNSRGNNELASSKSSPPKAPFKFAGYVAQLVEVVIAALVLLCLKLLPVENNLQEKTKASMFRGAFVMLFCGISIVQQGQSFRVARGEFWINFFRCTLGGLNGLLFFMALKYITMGESTAIVYSCTIWTSLLGFIVLREPLPATLALAVPVCLLGIVLLAQPDLVVDPRQELASELDHLAADYNSTLATISASDSPQPDSEMAFNTPPAVLDQVEETYFKQRWPGIFISLISSFILSVVIIILKFRKKTPIVTCGFYLGLAVVVVTVCVQMVIGFGSFAMSPLECFLHLSIGLLSYAEQFLFQWSLQFVPAGIYSIIQSMEIVLGFVFGAIFLHDLVLWTSVLGSVLIIGVVVMLILNDQLVGCFKSIMGLKAK